MAMRYDLLRHAGLAGRGRLALLVSLLLAVALLPTAVAVATGALVGAVGEADGAHGTSLLTAPLLALAGCLVALQGATLLVGPVLRKAERRIDGRLRQEVLRRVSAATTLAELERSDVQQDLAQFTTGAVFWMGSGVGAGTLAQVRLLTSQVGLLPPAIVLSWHRWWWGLVVAILCFALREVDNRGVLGFERVLAAHREDLTRTFQWREMLISAAYAKEVRVLGLAGWLVRRHDDAVAVYSGSLYEARRRLLRRQILLAVVVAGCCVAVFLTVVGAVAREELSVGGAVTVLTAVGVMLVAGDSSSAMRVESALPMARALTGLRARLPGRDGDAVIATGTEAGSQSPPLVTFRNVTFRYPGSKRNVLDGLDLELRPGEILALVGVNGAGKSTLTKLLTGLYPPTAGAIEVDGVRLNAGDRSDWSRRVYAVHQDFVRYQLSIRDNLRIAAPHADRSQLVDAARRTGVDDLVAQLPQGWHTVLGEGFTGGSQLSGGQWQRVAMTRAVLAAQAGAQVLVLDEPTANLDVVAELAAIRLISQARAKASVLLISHRFSTVRNADRIALLDQGRITEVGTHEELLAVNGTYARLFRIQAAGFRTGGGDDGAVADHLEVRP